MEGEKLEKFTDRIMSDVNAAMSCLHDMAYPETALRKMKEMLAEDGAVLISEEAAGGNLEENKNFLRHMMYNFSELHCLPQSMVFPGGK